MDYKNLALHQKWNSMNSKYLIYISTPPPPPSYIESY